MVEYYIANSKKFFRNLGGAAAPRGDLKLVPCFLVEEEVTDGSL